MKFIKVCSLHVEYFGEPRNWIRKQWINHKSLIQNRTIKVQL